MVRRRRWLRRLIVAVLMTATAHERTGAASSQSPSNSEQPQTVSSIDAGRYAEAEASARRRYDDVRGDASASLIAGDALIEALIRNGRGAEPQTRALAEAAVAARMKAVASPPGSLAVSLRQLGEVHFESGDYRLAVDTFRDALKVREMAGDTDSPALADVLDDLAKSQASLLTDVAFDEASRVVDRALAIRQAGGTSTDVARTLRIRGLLRQSKGDYANARSDLEASFALYEAAHPVHPDTAMTLAYLGQQLEFDGALEKAQETLSRACAMVEATLRPGHPDIATCFEILALALQELGNLAAAKSYFERGLAIAEESLGRDHPRFAEQLNDSANNFLLQGEFSTARTYYERARATYVKRLGAESNGATVETYNLALLYARLGDYRMARSEFERAIATWTRVLGADHPNVARALSALAELMADQGLHAQARIFYTRALRIRERALGADHPYVARTLSNLASSLLRLGRPREALTMSERSLRIWEGSGGQEGLAEALVIHGRILAESGDLAGSELAYQRAIDIRVPLVGAAHPSVAEVEVALAAIELRMGRRAESFVRALRGERVGREHARLTLGYLAEREALDYVAKRPRGLDLALSTADSSPSRAAVFNELILGRALALDEIGSRRRVIAEMQGGEASVLWTRLRATRERLANLVVRGPREGDPRQYATLVDQARAQKELAERDLAERSASFKATAQEVDFGLDEVRGALPTGAALISFVRYNHSTIDIRPATSTRPASGVLQGEPFYLAFVIRSDVPDPIVVRLGSAADIERTISAWRRSLMTGPSVPGAVLAESEDALRVLGGELRQRIWDPIAKHLAGVDRVFVVPDSAINLVPFAALPTARGGYLLERAPVIHYLSTERDLASSRAPATVGRGGLLAVGGPSFSDPTTFAALRGRSTGVSAGSSVRGAAAALPESPEQATGPGASYRGAPSRCPTFQNMRFAVLPGAAREAQDVAAVWNAFDSSGGRDTTPSQTLLGKAATEPAFKQLGPGRRVIHLATHGFFLGDACDAPLESTRSVGGLAGPTPARPSTAGAAQGATSENPLVLSGLVLAGANRRAAAGPDEDDGILTAEEVASLDLSGVEWAVLSACDTGLGLIRAGEGVFGLRRAFQVAGTHTVIMSLWPVEDRATRTWMLTLYRGRFERNLDTADAVRAASLAVLRDRRARGLSGHPFFWAGFVAAGDWR